MEEEKSLFTEWFTNVLDGSQNEVDQRDDAHKFHKLFHMIPKPKFILVLYFFIFHLQPNWMHFLSIDPSFVSAF